VQVRRKGQPASCTFRPKSEADTWAVEAEGKISRGKSVDAVLVDITTTFGFIIDLHIENTMKAGEASARASHSADMKSAATVGTSTVAAAPG
jgi:hypothetical protein